MRSVHDRGVGGNPPSHERGDLDRITNRGASLGLAIALLGELSSCSLPWVERARRASSSPANTPAIGVHPKYTFVGHGTPKPNVAASTARRERSRIRGSRCYGPDQIQTAYDIKPLYAKAFTGAGRTIVIIDASGARDHAGPRPSTAPGACPIRSSTCSRRSEWFDDRRQQAFGWALETSLDVEWARMRRTEGEDRPDRRQDQQRRGHPEGDEVRRRPQPRRRALHKLWGGRELRGPRPRCRSSTRISSHAKVASRADAVRLLRRLRPINRAAVTDAPPFQAAKLAGQLSRRRPWWAGRSSTRRRCGRMPGALPIVDPGGKYIKETTWNDPTSAPAAAASPCSSSARTSRRRS